MAEPALHQAVLEDRCTDIERLSKEKSLLEQTNGYGFTALELAQLLGKRKAASLLSPELEQKIIKIQHEGENEPSDYDLKRFEKVMGIQYISHLLFTDYDFLKEVIQNCPLILKTPIGKENRQLGQKYRSQIQEGFVADLTIKWIDESIGYGVFTNKDLPANYYVGEYTGLVRPLLRSRPDHNAYSFHYPTRFWSFNYSIIDALWQGNELRFLNHSEEPNLQPACLVDRGLLHMSFLTNQAVPADTELTFHYGADYWRRRS